MQFKLFAFGNLNEELVSKLQQKQNFPQNHPKIVEKIKSKQDIFSKRF